VVVDQSVSTNFELGWTNKYLGYIHSLDPNCHFAYGSLPMVTANSPSLAGGTIWHILLATPPPDRMSFIPRYAHPKYMVGAS
jgi:hypothetical protein